VPASATALLGIARPHLVRLTEKTEETSNLVILAGADVQFIDSIESKKALRVGSRVGVRLAARLTSGGKVLLADLPFEEVALLHPELADERGRAERAEADAGGDATAGVRHQRAGERARRGRGRHGRARGDRIGHRGRHAVGPDGAVQPGQGR